MKYSYRAELKIGESMLTAVLLFILGLILLIKGGDWFVDGATGVALRFHLPELLIGATVVSIGTTLPEVMVSSQAALFHNSGISYGNAIGSVICNASLIAALTAAVRPMDVERDDLRFPVTAFFIAAAFYALNAYVFGQFSRASGLVLLTMFVLYMYMTVRKMQDAPNTEELIEDNKEEVIEEVIEGELPPLWKDLVLLVVGAVLIAIGANLLVNNGTIIATAIGVPDSVIGLTMVALGTSLPELVTAVTSLLKGHSDLSLGNVIGANIFNLVLVSGMAITISPFSVPTEKVLMGVNASLLVDIPVMFLVMALLCVPTLNTGKLKRWQGVLLLCIYAAFTVFQFVS